MKDKITSEFSQFFHNLGIDPINAITVICIVISLTYLKDLKNWDELPSYRRSIIRSALIATAFLMIISLIRMCN